MAIIKHPSNEDEFLLVKEAPPPKLGEEEYDSYVDSDLWDLPSAQLNLLDGESPCGVAVEGAESVTEKIDLTKFDLNLALNQVALTAQFNLLKNICFFLGMEICDWISIMYEIQFNFTPPRIFQLSGFT